MSRLEAAENKVLFLETESASYTKAFHDLRAGSVLCV